MFVRHPARALTVLAAAVFVVPAFACTSGEAGDGGAQAGASLPSSETAAEGVPERIPGQEVPERIPGQGVPERVPGQGYAGPVLDLPPESETDADAHETERDWVIARGTVEWALGQGLDALPVGEAAAVIGSTFVGAPYVPGTLELPGPEGLVVNLRSFDCVTFVEHALVLARIATGAAGGVGEGGARALLDDEEAFRTAYRSELTGLRYRSGVIDGYPSRLHYFTEWLDHAVAGGLADDVTAELGGVVDERPVHFMSSNPGAYRQLDEDASLLEPIREVEARLSAGERLFVPQERIGDVEEGIRNGDIIAAVSTVDGLDIAHTGIALWHAGRLHLLHAPLVGESVEISARPLAERIQGISGQKGIRVARPR